MQAQRCPTCGSAVSAGAAYCQTCGADLRAPGMHAREGRAYAGFWRRFGAWFLDGVIVGVATFVLAIIVSPGDPGDASVVPSLVGLVLGAAYYSIGNGLGGTPGKRAFGMRVISDIDGSEPGLARGFVRWLISYFSALALLLGYFWAIWDHKKQTWHDKAAGTVVVQYPGM